MADLEVFKLNPKGKVEINLAWTPHRVEFMSGKSQFQRRRIYAKKSYSFTVCGGRKDYDWLRDFYNSHRGQFDPFYFDYDGKREIVFFGDKLKIKVKREVGKIVGFEASISLDLDFRRGMNLPVPKTTDELPKPTGGVEYSSDWNTKVYTTSTTKRRIEYESPREKLSVKFKGKKPERDKIIRLYESHEMLPCLLPYDGKKVSVRLPESITITDYREIKKIVGYSCEMDLEIV